MFFSLGTFSFKGVLKGLGLLLLCLFGVFVQGTLIHANFPNMIAPDFTVLIVVYLGLRHQNMRGLIASFCLGLIVDFASAVYLGPNAAGCVLGFCVTGVIAKRVFAEKTFAIVSITFWSSLIKSSTYVLMLVLYVSGDLLSFTSLQSIILESVLTALVAPVVFKLFTPKQAKSRYPNSFSLSSSSNH